MKRFVLAAVFALAAVVMVDTAVSGVALSGAPADAAGRWRLDFTAGEFSYVVVGAGRKGRVQYYLPYTVTNGSEGKRAPRLNIEIKTNTGKTFGDHFDGRAFAQVRKKQGKKSVKSTAALRSTPLDKGGSTEGVAHFGHMDDNADELEVRISGLWDPVYRDRRGKLWNEKRVLVIKYVRRGDEYRRHEDRIELVSAQPVVDGEKAEIERKAKPKR